MLRNYLLIALRTLRKQPGYTSINIGGLALGLAACLLISLYVQDELSYDRFHAQADRIYRVVYDVESGGAATHWAYSHSAWGEQMEAVLPEVAESVRLSGVIGDQGFLVEYGEKVFSERLLYYADASVFDVFTVPLAKGDPGTALRAPYTLVLSETAARKYFGDEDPVGKTLTLNNDARGYTVTGVFEDLPSRTHLPFDFLVSLSTILQENPDWGTVWIYTYVLLKDGASPEALAARMPGFLEEHVAKVGFLDSITGIGLQALPDLHLHSHRQGEPGPGGNPATLYIFAAVALLILVIACINFMNLATARSAGRAKEVGMRKVLGAYRRQVAGQFLGEAVLLCLLSLVLALFLADLFLPVFNALAGKALALRLTGGGLVLPGLVLVTLLVGLAAGGYPALYLSAFRPATVLKGEARGGSRRGLLRQTLVVVQFVVSIALLTASAVVYDQLRYVRSRGLGFDKEQLLTLSVEGTPLGQGDGFETFKRGLLAHPRIQHVSGSTNRLGERVWIWNFRPEGWEGEEDWTVQAMLVDYDYLATYGIELAAGRDFSEEHETDLNEAVLLNESAARFLGWEEAVGRKIMLPPNSPDPNAERSMGTVVGVVKDFHYASLHDEVAPLVLKVGSGWRRYATVRLDTDDLPGTLAFVEAQWRAAVPDRPLQASFVSDQFDQLYQAEARLGRVISAFTFFAILVACLGLLGLASFTAEGRRKEIGVRKVLGASVASIVGLLTKDFARLVLIAFVVAAPLAYVAARQWLGGFAYHTDPAWWMFAASGGAALVVALLTVSYQSAKAALADPVESLRYE